MVDARRRDRALFDRGRRRDPGRKRHGVSVGRNRGPTLRLALRLLRRGRHRLGDRVTRKYLVAAGVILWSIATIGTGLVTGYTGMLVTRALIGIGEAGYATVAPAMIADLYPERTRGRAIATDKRFWPPVFHHVAC